MTDAKNVTERESYVIAQALYEFIRLEQSKPREMRRWLDEDEAKAILHARFDNELSLSEAPSPLESAVAMVPILPLMRPPAE